MLLLYVIAKAIEFPLRRFSQAYQDMSFGNRRNTVTYMMDIFITATGLILQLIASPVLRFRYTFDNVAMLKVTALIISGLVNLKHTLIFARIF